MEEKNLEKVFLIMGYMLRTVDPVCDSGGYSYFLVALKRVEAGMDKVGRIGDDIILLVLSGQKREETDRLWEKILPGRL